MADITGEYDVAMELSVGLVNCVLAAIHENENENYPRLLHSARVRIDDRPRGTGDPVAPAERTGVRTRADVQLSTPTVSLPTRGLADPIWSRSRASVRTAFRADQEEAALVGPGGALDIFQPTCWPRITARVRLRAWLLDRPQELPEFLHGDIRLTAGLARTNLRGGGVVLGLDFASGLEVGFEPAAGTTVRDEQRALVGRILRNFLRGDAEPASFKLDLPNEVRRFDYELEPTGAHPSTMLMLRLSDRPSGPKGPASVTARLIAGGDDFAVAIGRGYLIGLLRSELLRGLPPEFSASGTGYRARVRPNWPGATVEFEPGRIVFSVDGSGSVTYGAWGIDTTDEWSFTIRQAFTLGVESGSLRPALAGEPDVQLHGVAVFEGTIREKARSAIKSQLGARIDAVSGQLREALDVARPLRKILSAIHPAPAAVALTGVQIRPDGVVVPGTVGLVPSRPVVVRRATSNGSASALESWIPGGTIERFVWGSRLEEHRFVSGGVEGGGHGGGGRLGVSVALRCLSVVGTRVTRGGGLVPVSANDCPILVAALPAPDVPPRRTGPLRRPLLPLLQPRDGEGIDIVGHYDPWAAGVMPEGGPTNVLVHFAEGPWDHEARLLDEALAASGEAAVVVVAVLTPDALRHVGRATLDGRATLLLTDDPSGGWTSVFDVAQAPATVLLGPDGQVRWRHEGKLDAKRLRKALEEHLERGGEVSWRMLRLAVGASDAAPDAPLRLGDGRELPLRRLRGGSAVLSFWSSSSEPSVDQLRELSRALEAGAEPRPYVVGIGDGETPERVAEVAKRERLSFPLVADAERVVGRRYGVSCWPAVVQVGPEGRVEATDLGLVRGLDPCAEIVREPLTPT